MEIHEFIGLQEFYNKRKDADILLLDDEISNLQQQIFGFKGRSTKADFSLEGMFEKLAGSLFQLKKISTEVLLLSHLGDAPGSELMEEIRKQAKALRLYRKRQGSKSRKSGPKPQKSRQK